MKLFIASDHAGFEKKHSLIKNLENSYEVYDLGPYNMKPDDDYPIYANKVAIAVKENPGSMGILLCKSGEGMAIAANKVDGIRAVNLSNEHKAVETRQDNDSNVLSLSAEELSNKEIYGISKVWLDEPFSELERHKRRIAEISKIEEGKL